MNIKDILIKIDNVRASEAHKAAEELAESLHSNSVCGIAIAHVFGGVICNQATGAMYVNSLDLYFERKLSDTFMVNINVLVAPGCCSVTSSLALTAKLNERNDSPAVIPASRSVTTFEDACTTEELATLIRDKLVEAWVSLLISGGLPADIALNQVLSLINLSKDSYKQSCNHRCHLGNETTG